MSGSDNVDVAGWTCPSARTCAGTIYPDIAIHVSTVSDMSSPPRRHYLARSTCYVDVSGWDSAQSALHMFLSYSTTFRYLPSRRVHIRISFRLSFFILFQTTSQNTLACHATHCNTLQHTATHCTTLQHIATHLTAYPHRVRGNHI